MDNDAQPLAPLLRKLISLGPVTQGEVAATEALPLTLCEYRPGYEIVRERDRPAQACILLSGMCCRFKIIGDGDRQINSFHIPGDMPDLQSLLLHQMDHGLLTLTRAKVALVPHPTLLQLVAAYPRLGLLLWRDTLIDGSIFREWMCSIGRRSARVRVAHLICELFLRYRNVGLVEDMTMPFHLTQTHIGDAQGLSVVHVNRVVKSLKRDGLISLSNRRLTIVDWESLTQIGDFDEAYLHLTPES
ncbi:CRP-like cAMP-binding protein [Bosea sp. OAE506]|uniref:Crp/Fnr family transcriptional regulator n=1 Tax=Bosea sp. OAE506 TaxID=2663870 RepID=UPI00178A9989